MREDTDMKIIDQLPAEGEYDCGDEPEDDDSMEPGDS
jgi:hypothetical protein